jgi:transposase
MREALVQTRARYISLISALLRREGLRVASGSAASFVRRVAKLALPGQLKSEIAPLLAVFVSVDRQLAWIDTRLEHLARTDETVERLCTAPSVGPVTAAAFSTTVDDPRRFKSAHQWRPIWGSLRANGAPGRSKARGTSPKAGNNRMRKLLVQVAVSILRLRSPRTEALRKWATGIAVRRGKKIAIVALARRMSEVLSPGPSSHFIVLSLAERGGSGLHSAAQDGSRGPRASKSKG